MQHQFSIRDHLFKNAQRRRRRRLRTAFFLAFFLGPLGLFYTDPFGGFAMFAAGLISLLMFPTIAVIIIWIICIAWAVIKIKRANRIAATYEPYLRIS